MTDQPTLRDRITDAIDDVFARWQTGLGGQRPQDAIRDAALAALAAPVDQAEEELRYWKSKLGAVTDGRDALQRENARLRKDLAAAERIRENADFHLGQEMARRQLAEKAAAHLTVDRAAVLREAADVAAQVGRRVFSDAPIERRGEGAWETAADLRRMADEAQQPACGNCGHPAAWHDPWEGCVGPDGIGSAGSGDCTCTRSPDEAQQPEEAER